VARQYGVPKTVSIAEARMRCPDIVLINGEDLTPYNSYLQSNGGKRVAGILQVHQLKCHQSCYQLNVLWIDERRY
jgi:hypothetical protein